MKWSPKRSLFWAVLGLCLGSLAVELHASSLKISLGIRETNSPGVIFADGGSSNGIEWVNRDGQTLTADGTWQLFTFTPATDPLLAFAGATANSSLEPGHEWATIEHIRILNDQGITSPIRLWIDDVTNTVATGPVIQDFEAATLGSEVMFQEPNFSGSTAANLLAGSSTVVTNSMANSGVQALLASFQFVDNDPTRWVRLTTFGTPNQPNPRVRIIEATGAPTSISFYAKAILIPEPTSLVLLASLTVAGMAFRRRRP